jgi:hypothetical protein
VRGFAETPSIIVAAVITMTGSGAATSAARVAGYVVHRIATAVDTSVERARVTIILVML